jgi:hypothetical protein
MVEVGRSDVNAESGSGFVKMSEALFVPLTLPFALVFRRTFPAAQKEAFRTREI